MRFFERNRDGEIERRPVPSLRATKNTRTNGLADAVDDDILLSGVPRGRLRGGCSPDVLLVAGRSDDLLGMLEQCERGCAEGMCRIERKRNVGRYRRRDFETRRSVESSVYLRRNKLKSRVVWSQ